MILSTPPYIVSSIPVHQLITRHLRRGIGHPQDAPDTVVVALVAIAIARRRSRQCRSRQQHGIGLDAMGNAFHKLGSRGRGLEEQGFVVVIVAIVQS